MWGLLRKDEPRIQNLGPKLITNVLIYYFILCQAEIKISNDDSYNDINNC